MAALLVMVVVALVAIPIYGWQTGDWEGAAIKQAVTNFEASLLSVPLVTTNTACVEWSWMADARIYTVKQKIISVDAITDHEISVTAETCGHVGPGRLYFQTRGSPGYPSSLHPEGRGL